MQAFIRVILVGIAWLGAVGCGTDGRSSAVASGLDAATSDTAEPDGNGGVPIGTGDLLEEPADSVAGDPGGADLAQPTDDDGTSSDAGGQGDPDALVPDALDDDSALPDVELPDTSEPDTIEPDTGDAHGEVDVVVRSGRVRRDAVGHALLRPARRAFRKRQRRYRTCSRRRASSRHRSPYAFLRVGRPADLRARAGLRARTERGRARARAGNARRARATRRAT